MKKEFGQDEMVLDPALLEEKRRAEVAVDAIAEENIELAAAELAEEVIVADAGAIAASGAATTAAAGGISTSALVIGGGVAAAGIAVAASDDDGDDNSAELAAAEAARKAAEEKAAAEEAARKEAEQDAADAKEDAADAEKEAADAEKRADEAEKAAEAEENKTIVLTTDVDDVVGTAVDNVIRGTIGSSDSTFSVVDVIDGGEGIDTLQLVDVVGSVANPSFINVDNIETLELRSVNGLSIDATSGDFDNIVSTQSTAIDLTAADVSDVTVSGVSGRVDIEGGKNVTVNDSAVNNIITVGTDSTGTSAGVAAKGDVVITDLAQGSGTITVFGGNDVTIDAKAATTGIISATGAKGDVDVDLVSTGAGSVTVSGTAGSVDLDITASAAGGASATVSGTAGSVDIDTVVTLAASTAGTATAGTITVVGGDTVSVSQDISSVASVITDDSKAKAGAVNITSDGTTTSVSVSAQLSEATVAADAVDGAKQVVAVKFKALAEGDSIAVLGSGNLTFTAAKALTASEVASVFADLVSGDTQSDAAATLGSFEGTLAGFSTGAANSDVVEFTSNAASTAAFTPGSILIVTAETASTNASGEKEPTETVVTSGLTAVPADESQNEAVANTVDIDDASTASIQTISIDTYTTATIGNSAAVDVLETLNVKNGGDVTIVTSSGSVKSLDLNIENVSGTVSASEILGLDLVSANSSSTIELVAAKVKDLTIDATADLTIGATNTVLTALETVAISGTSDVVLNSAVGSSVTSFDASQSSGDIEATIDASKASYVGSTGSDELTLSAATIEKSVNLGGGDDTLVLASGNLTFSGTVAKIEGGAGTDTLVINAADIANADALELDKITGFEVLQVTDTGGFSDTTVDVGTFNNPTTVIVNGNLGSGTSATVSVTLNNVVDGSTVVLEGVNDVNASGSAIVDVNVLDAGSGTNESITVSLAADVDSTGSVEFNVDDIEAVSIVVEDADVSTAGSFDAVVSADAAASFKLSGDTDIKLDLTGDKALTIDATQLTGGLTYTADEASAQTVLGGSGDDILVASGEGDTLRGGAGDDQLTGAEQTNLFGGAGSDTFVVSAPADLNKFSIIKDLEAGDVIDFNTVAGAGTQDAKDFITTAVVLQPTADFEDYANAAAELSEVNGDAVVWFQYEGNTFAVANVGTTDTEAFAEDNDLLIAIDGLVDLSTASYSTEFGTLEIA